MNFKQSVAKFSLFSLLSGVLFTGCSQSSLQAPLPASNAITAKSAAVPIAATATASPSAIASQPPTSSDARQLHGRRYDSTDSVTPDQLCPQAQTSLSGTGCATMPPVKHIVQPAPAGTFVPTTNQARLYNGATTQSGTSGSGNVIDITQGASAALELFCVGAYSDGSPDGLACPPTSISSWTAYGSAGITTSFSQSTTTGSNTTVLYFATTSSTPPGYYSFEICIDNNQSYDGAYCAPIVIEVDQYQTGPLEIPTGQFSVKLQIGPVGLLGGDVPDEGHMYVELYAPNGAPYAELGAGPYKVGNTTYMYTAKYGELANFEPFIDITNYMPTATALSLYNRYKQYQDNGEAPFYIVNSFNSNSWVVGMLLADGIPQATVTGWVNQLKNDYNVQAVGSNNGTFATPCFLSPARRLPNNPVVNTESLAFPNALTSAPGGCTAQGYI